MKLNLMIFISIGAKTKCKQNLEDFLKSFLT